VVFISLTPFGTMGVGAQRRGDVAPQLFTLFRTKVVGAQRRVDAAPHT
jgi:hypothetical protein